VTDPVENSFGYSGEMWDKTTGLQYLRARWYDPSMGRFINEDTYEGELTNPLSLNLYTYVENNPLGYTDPSGAVKVSIPSVWKKIKKGANWVVGTLNDQQQYIQRQVWKDVLVPQFIESKGFYLTGELLRHSLQDKPSDLLLNDQSSYEVNLVKESAEYKQLLGSLLNSEQAKKDGYFYKDSSLSFESGDLKAAIHNAYFKIYGERQQDGAWKVTAAFSDVYDFKWENLLPYLTQGDLDQLMFWFGNDLAFLSQETTAINQFTTTIVVHDTIN
ncbi:RHS repeat-associated core domain-containing protein, partial [Paenibacillus kobensis]|uniref:RHS repeat-associated core domain-containing protein n=1 Tax=Paenibacillus kobensis TaxID=59841 RepID=UPI0013E34812